jgi:hypothetical protein
MRCIVEYDAALVRPCCAVYLRRAAPPHAPSPDLFRQDRYHVSVAQLDRALASEARDRRSTRRGNSNAPGAEAVLKTVCTARYEGRDLSAPPIRKANRSGTGAGWKPRGRGNSVGIVRSAFRHHGKSTGRVPGARSKRDGAGNGMGFVPSAFRQFSRDRGCIGAPLRR